MQDASDHARSRTASSVSQVLFDKTNNRWPIGDMLFFGTSETRLTGILEDSINGCGKTASAQP